MAPIIPSPTTSNPCRALHLAYRVVRVQFVGPTLHILPCRPYQPHLFNRSFTMNLLSPTTKTTPSKALSSMAHSGTTGPSPAEVGRSSACRSQPFPVYCSLFNTLACERVIKRSFSPTEFPSLVEVIFPHQDRGDVIRSLFEDNVQAFVDVLDEARLPFPAAIGRLGLLKFTVVYSVPQALVVLELPLAVRKKCIKILYTTCRDRALIPRAMNVSVRYDPAKPPLYRGGFGDVWKGEYCGREVAIKVIKTYSNTELQKVRGVSRWLNPRSTFRLTEYRTEFLQGGRDVEDPPASECRTANWCERGR